LLSGLVSSRNDEETRRKRFNAKGERMEDAKKRFKAELFACASKPQAIENRNPLEVGCF
jgi:hypothetical protein